MEEAKQLAANADPLLACSLCRSLLQEAVQLTCLHNCCRRCFCQAVSQGNSRAVACTVCGTTTVEGTEQTNSFIEKELQHYLTIIESRSCGVCRGNGELDKLALVWCPDCRQSLCGDCIAPHRHYYRQHSTQSVEELKSLEEICPKPSVSYCPTHKKPLEIACLNCEQAKCTLCWADCKKSKHEFHIVGEDAFYHYIGEVVSRVSFMDAELLRKSAVLERPKSLIKNTQLARALHLEQISERKRRIVDSVEMAYQQIESLTKDAYEDIEKDAALVSHAADRIASRLLDARSYIGRLIKSNKKCDILNQQKFVQERLRVLSAEVDTLNDKLGKAVRAVKFDPMLPEDLENVMKQWIGMPLLYSELSFAYAEPDGLSSPIGHPTTQKKVTVCRKDEAALSFSSTSASVQLPVECYDVQLPVECYDVAMDGRLLLAAGEHGLIEVCSVTGCELSRWLPSKQSNGKDDWVQTVAALSDGRSAVGLCYAQFVVLLRRSQTGSSDGKNTAVDAWTEDHRLERLRWHPGHLSAHGDVLAVTDGNRHLLLMSIGGGRQLRGELWREYSIRSLAVAARVVVTGGSRLVELNGSRRTHVLDAHLVADGDERLWRHELSNDEVLGGVCSDSTSSCLYVVVRARDRSSGRVSAFSLDSGIELMRTAIKFDPGLQPLLLPERLSLSELGAAAERQESSTAGSSSRRALLLAVLCYDPWNRQKAVTVHRST